MLLNLIDFGLPLGYFAYGYSVDHSYVRIAASGGPYDAPYIWNSVGARYATFYGSATSRDTIFCHFFAKHGGGPAYVRAYAGAAATMQFQVTIDMPAYGCTQGKWYWVGVKIKVDNAAGAWEVRINGQTAASASGVDTQGASTGDIGSIMMSPGSEDDGGGIAGVIIHDDDDVGDGYSGFLDAEQRLLRLVPNGQGVYSGFSGSGTGANYENIDETSVDGDGSYNESGTVGAKDSNVIENVPTLQGFVAAAVILDTLAKKTDAATTQLTTFRREGSTDTDLATHTLSTGYERFIDNLGAMGETDINALEVGYKVAAA